MGINVKIELPSDVRLHDVAMVMGVLVGFPKELKSLGDKSGSTYLEVKGIKIYSAVVPSCACISLASLGKGNMLFINDEVMFHYELEGRDYRGMYPRATPFWIAMGRRLVEFFGGRVQFNDSIGTEWDLEEGRPRRRNNPSDGREWQVFQDAMFAIKPLTFKELADAEKFSPYAVV